MKITYKIAAGEGKIQESTGKTLNEGCVYNNVAALNQGLCEISDAIYHFGVHHKIIIEMMKDGEVIHTRTQMVSRKGDGTDFRESLQVTLNHYDEDGDLDQWFANRCGKTVSELIAEQAALIGYTYIY